MLLLLFVQSGGTCFFTCLYSSIFLLPFNMLNVECDGIALLRALPR